MKAKLILLLFLIIITLGFISCGDKDAGSVPSSTYSGLAGNLQAAGNDMVPDSLASSSSLMAHSLAKTTAGDNPCEGMDLFECQPILVKMYLAMGQEFAGHAATFLNEVQNGLDTVADGASGTTTGDEGETIHYSKTDSENFEILIRDAGDTTSVGYLGLVGGNQITVEMADADAEGSFVINIDMTYTDINNYSILVKFSMESTCDPTDTRAPKKAMIKVVKANGLWTGSAGLYSPLWGYNLMSETGPTCAELADPDGQVLTANSINGQAGENGWGAAILTQFVGNDTAAKAGVAISTPDVTTVSDAFTNHAINQIFSGTYYTATPPDLSSYTNPFCFVTATPSNIGWGNTCSGSDSTVSATSFDTTDLLAPDALKTLAPSVRAAL